MSGNEEKAIRVITFTGKVKDWKMWSAQFLARASRKGFKDVLTGNTKTVTTTTDAQGVTTKSIDAGIKKLNNLAYDELILSMTEDISFALVEEAKNDALPDGDAQLAWTNLKS